MKLLSPPPRLRTRRAILGSLLGSAAVVATWAQEYSTSLQIGRALLDVQFHSVGFDLSRDEIRAWVATCARAVADYLGDFPVGQARIEINASDRPRGVTGGRSWGYRGARCQVALGLRSTKEDLNRDWVLTHEMLHFAFPSMPRRNSWIEEGVSTYVEPIARANAGLLSQERVWKDMMRDMPQGLPKDDDEGLDNTHTWGRTYWGGAIFCLLADIRIRQATNTRKGLPDALRAINLAGGNITTEWSLVETLKIADRAVGGNLLSDLYKAMGSTPAGTPHRVDLPALWAELGVKVDGPRVAFDDRAPLASTRRAIAGPTFR